MKRKWIYTFSLIGFFLMWGVFGFVAAAPRNVPVTQGTVVPEENPPVVPAATANAAIPVTGQTQSVTGIFLIYALFALGALILILILLNAANKRTIPDAYRKEPPDTS
jgi:tellurite resistance protein TehA-like permease